MDKYLLTQKEKTSRFLTEYFLSEKKAIFSANRWGDDVYSRLVSFCLNGKMIRGSMVIYVYLLYNKKITSDVLRVAAAIEIIHSSLLIHDDIMDNDTLRRGNSTLFKQYEEKYPKQTREFGKNMAICVGDIGFFLGMRLLNTIKSEKKNLIIELITKEIISVGLGQMEDIFLSAKDAIPTEKEILNTYKWKTGRYTFSLPFAIGSMLANSSTNSRKLLEKIGEDMGILFQLHDDKLGLYGSDLITGKTKGSDIRENKKTLYWLYLFTSANSLEKQKLQNIFGNEKISVEDMEYVYNLLQIYLVKDKIEKLQKKLMKQINKNIALLDIKTSKKRTLESLLALNLEREK